MSNATVDYTPIYFRLYCMLSYIEVTCVSETFAEPRSIHLYSGRAMMQVDFDEVFKPKEFDAPVISAWNEWVEEHGVTTKKFFEERRRAHYRVRDMRHTFGTRLFCPPGGDARLS